MHFSDQEKSSIDFEDSKVRNILAWFMMIYILFSTVFLIIIINITKRLFGRERPTRIAEKYRLCNMRKLEHHKSFPSGDASAASFFTAIYIHIFGVNIWFMVISTVMVSLGRVYVFCHWIGDTVAGSILGTTVSYFLFNEAYFSAIAKPLFVAFAKMMNLDIDLD